MKVLMIPLILVIATASFAEAVDTLNVKTKTKISAAS